MTPAYKTALIVGAGQGLSASLARLLTHCGLSVALAARSPEKLSGLCTETGASAFACDAQDHAQVARLFDECRRNSHLRTSSSTTRAPGSVVR